MLSSPLLLLFLSSVCWRIALVSSFSLLVNTRNSQQQRRWIAPHCLAATDDDDNATPDATAANTNERPSNLVDKDTFVAAVDALKVEITKETGQAFPADEVTTTADGDQLVYVLGRIADLRLSFAPTPPGLALTDATGLTIVAAVGESSMDSGIQPFDTITSIGADGGSFRQETNGMSLSDTTTTLTAAANYAVEKGLTEIEIEVNRLMKGYYK